LKKLLLPKNRCLLRYRVLKTLLIQTRQEIIALQKKIAQEMGSEHGEVFDAHLLVLEDRMLIEEVISRVKKEKLAVDFIFSEVLKRYAGVFSRIEDEYLKERISDINDVGRRILRNLLGKKRKVFLIYKKGLLWLRMTFRRQTRRQCIKISNRLCDGHWRQDFAYCHYG